MTHTQAPWKFYPVSHDGFDGPTVQSAFGLIVHIPTPMDQEGHANARLIQMAPELLEIVEAFIEGYSPMEQARVVVTLARGRPVSQVVRLESDREKS